MQILARVSVAAGLLAMSATGAWLVVRGWSVDASAPAITQPMLDDEPITMVQPVDDPPEQSPMTVAVEEPTEATWLPPGYVEDISREKTEELASFLEDWRKGEDSPAIDYRRGIIFAESDEDRGDDGPYPKSADAEAFRACGSQALWLRQYLTQRLQTQELSCSNNVCSYPGMEYAPSGTLVFRQLADGRWAIVAWTQVFEAALAEDVVDKNYRDVIAGLIRLRDQRCPGEPAGTY